MTDRASTRRNRAHILGAASLVALGAAFGASAQPVEEVTVSGSRIVRSGFNAPTPTTTVDSLTIEQRAVTQISDIINVIPAIRPLIGPGVSQGRPTTGASQAADLRGLGAMRTLVLANGRRIVPQITSFTAPSTYQVDLGIIPTIAIDNVEVVTGGASAAWGSDAVAGVVNLLMKEDFEGFQASVQGGVTGHGDGKEYRIGLLGGLSFFGGRLHVVAAGDYNRNFGTGDIYSRDWGARQIEIVTNPCPPGTAVSANCPTGPNGLTQYFSRANVNVATATPGGLITLGPLRGTQFGPGGTPTTFTFGTEIYGNQMVGGTSNPNPRVTGIEMDPPVKKLALYTHIGADITDTFSMFLEANHARVRTQFHGRISRDLGNLTIQNTNAFLPAATRTAMTTAGITNFRFGRIYSDIGPLLPDVDQLTWRVTTGMKGKMGGTWGWDAYYQYGLNRHMETVKNQIIQSRLTLAIDSVLSGGVPVCRSTLTNPTNGCVPINLFGSGSPSAAALNYVTGTSFSNVRNDQSVAAINFHGDLFDNWAGPISVAFGAEYRREQQLNTVDATSLAAGFKEVNNAPLNGSFSVKEGYVEALVPLLKDAPFAKELNLNVAGRHADYSFSGSANTWKVGLTNNVDDEFRLRGTISRDIRAPNLYELYLEDESLTATHVDSATRLPSGAVNPFFNQSFSVTVVTSGSLALKPEVANSISAGIAYRPAYVPGLEISLDYFDVDVTKAIANVTPTQMIQLCERVGTPFYCSNIARNAAGQITRIDNFFVNLATLNPKGFDLEIAYDSELSRFIDGALGDISVRVLGTYTQNFFISDTFSINDTAGQLGNGTSSSRYYAPTFRANLSLAYLRDGWMVRGDLKYSGSGKQDGSLTTANYPTNDVPPIFYLNIAGSVDLMADGQLQLFGAVNNVFDQDPPQVLNPLLFSPTNAAQYDIIGRRFQLGLRYKM